MAAVVSWLVLLLSGVLESVWATTLGRSEGSSRLWPSVVFAVALVLSMPGFAYALRELPTGTAYAVRVGIGAALTTAHAMVSGQEPASTVRLLLLTGRVGCVVAWSSRIGSRPTAIGTPPPQARRDDCRGRACRGRHQLTITAARSGWRGVPASRRRH